ncbi:peptidoglycan-binding domain-containing protein [Brevibacterium sp. 'Marine']|uniref:peptidoglycan-binding domain-containing protein n=1 Tax=Brevibacterium sp. 'Marine' TaxID=2725563 RepID=UPI00145F8E27|nr:peptidoglycan-binding domain-containing protein [Brevibacterium sp. 'Marine']
MSGSIVIRSSIGALACAMLSLAGVAAVAPQAQAFDICTTFDTAYRYPIKYGERDDPPELRGVAQAQCYLLDLGYEGIDVTGKFDRSTLSAVKDWQKRHPWIGRTDGEVDSKTWASFQAAASRVI